MMMLLQVCGNDDDYGDNDDNDDDDLRPTSDVRSGFRDFGRCVAATRNV